MMRSKGLLAAFFIAAAAAGEAAAFDSPRVGDLGDRARLAIEGANIFSPDQIRDALFSELAVLAASNKQAPLHDLTAALTKKTIAGYQAGGFPDVKLSVVAEADTLKMVIEEGERYTNGGIEVSGHANVDVEKIKQGLASSETAGLKRRALWPADEAASFDPESIDQLAAKARELISDQGYYRPRLKVAVEPDRDAKKAILRVQIAEEGPRATVRDIRLRGNQDNTLEAVITYLGLDPQLPLTDQVRKQIERKLLASGRFLEVHWDFGKPDERENARRARLILKENELAPPLDEPISREEAALLKAAEWFDKFEHGDHEAVIDARELGVLVLAPRRGFIVMVNWPGKGETPENGPGFTHAVVMDEERVGLYSLVQRRKIVAAPPPSPIIGKVVLHLIGDAPDWDAGRKMAFGVGMSTKTRDGYDRHVKVQLKLTPPAALSLTRKHDADFQWDGDVLCAKWGDGRLRIHAQTGELLEHVVRDGDTDNGDLQSVAERIVLKPGEFDRRLAQIERASADWPNLADARRPLSCLAEFLCHEMALYNANQQRRGGERFDDLFDGLDERDVEQMKKLQQEFVTEFKEHSNKEERGYAALAKAISQGLLGPFDKLALEAFQPHEVGFPIPLPPFHVRAASLDELYALAREVSPAYGVRVGDLLFPRDGWMNAAWRRGLFANANKPPVFSYDLPDPREDDYGPLRALAMAEVLHAAGADFPSSMYALRGQAPQSAERFRDDCSEVISGVGFVSECLVQIAAVMRQLNASDIEALAEFLVGRNVLDQQQAGAFEFAALRAHGHESPAEGLAKALDGLWRMWLSGWAERRLETLAARGEPNP